jgi:hypothetical protein
MRRGLWLCAGSPFVLRGRAGKGTEDCCRVVVRSLIGASRDKIGQLCEIEVASP